MSDRPPRSFKSNFISEAMTARGGSSRLIDGTNEASKMADETKSPKKADKKSSRSKQSSRQEEKRRKKASKQRPLTKGLSPPKESPKRKTAADDDRYNKSDQETGIFDKTQWERSRWGANYTQSGYGSTTGLAKTTASMTTVDGKKSQATIVGSGVPGEARQIEQVRGEHLKDRPKLQLIFLAVEGAFCAVTMSVWGGAADNPFLPFLLTLINLLFVFSLICAAFAVEVFRFQVKKVETDEEVGAKTKHTTKYQVPYRWRFWLLGCHMARAILLCACITIMALDNDFDGGSIAVLAIQPFHLLIVAVQVFIILRPKRKE